MKMARSLHAIVEVNSGAICPAAGQVVVGGYSYAEFHQYTTHIPQVDLSSVDIFPRPPSDTCFVPDLPQARHGHSLSLLSGGRLVVCGGNSGGGEDSCIS